MVLMWLKERGGPGSSPLVSLPTGLMQSLVLIGPVARRSRDGPGPTARSHEYKTIEGLVLFHHEERKPGLLRRNRIKLKGRLFRRRRERSGGGKPRPSSRNFLSRLGADGT